MTCEEFLKELAHRLRRLPKEEREEALAFYRDYLADAGPEQEAEALAALGNPKEVARQIIQEAAVKAGDPKSDQPHGTLSTLWLAILGVCAAPVAIPLAAAVVICLVAAGIVVLALAASAILILATGIFSGGLSLVYGAAELFTSPANGAVVIGIGLIAAGVALAGSVALAEGCKAGAKALATACSKLYHRRKHSN